MSVPYCEYCPQVWQPDTVCRVCRRRAPTIVPSLWNVEPDNEFAIIEEEKIEERRLTVRARKVERRGALDQKCGGGRRVVRKRLGNS